MVVGIGALTGGVLAYVMENTLLTRSNDIS